MSIPEQIAAHLATLPEPRQSELRTLHERILALLPGVRLWFHDGKDDTGKVISNPNIGYGFHTFIQAKGKRLDWFKASISATSTGISVYLLGIKDKEFLKDSYAPTIGKASISGYCIKFKKLSDINRKVLEEAILRHLEQEYGSPT